MLHGPERLQVQSVSQRKPATATPNQPAGTTVSATPTHTTGTTVQDRADKKKKRKKKAKKNKKAHKYGDRPLGKPQ